jgi:hypothetical protein
MREPNIKDLNLAHSESKLEDLIIEGLKVDMQQNKLTKMANVARGTDEEDASEKDNMESV